MSVNDILFTGTLLEKKALFLFDQNESDETVILKFNLWGRYFFPQYFENKDAPFHEDINLNNLRLYRGEIDAFVDIAFRGAGKDVKTKLFISYCVLNDLDHRRKYFKVLSADLTNAKQTVTDIYNMLVSPQIALMYPNIFEKTSAKREETMASFTTAQGVKVLADSVGVDQRGAIQEESRPDFLWLNDIETRRTLRSAVITKAIKDSMEEARTGLQRGGGWVVTANYISETGNVHSLIHEKLSSRKVVLIVPILKDGKPTWDRYTLQDIENMKKDDDDFMGERMCKPDASKDIYFDREVLDRLEIRQPVKDVSGFKIYRNYDPSHRYAGGHDVAGGVGLDSSASVFMDFSTVPAQVVATFHSNTVLPEAFGDEIYHEANHFGGCLIAPENNKFDQTILKARQLGAIVYKARKGQTLKTITMVNPTYTWGWSTNSLTRSKMFADFRKAVGDGLVALNDKDLIQEAKGFTRNDLLDNPPDPRDVLNVTRHFDLLTAACICWQMKDLAEVKMVEVPSYLMNDAKDTNPAE